jgi:hypothetical protein
MSRVSHLRSLFEEKVRQANEEKEKAKGQLNGPRSGIRRRGSFNSSNENLFDRSHLNGSNNSTPSQSQEKFSIDHASSSDSMNEKRHSMTFHVVQEPRSYVHLQREDSQNTKIEPDNVTHVTHTNATEENSPPPVDHISHTNNDHVEVPHISEETNTSVATTYVAQESPRDLPAQVDVPEVHIVHEEPSQPSPRSEEFHNAVNSIVSEPPKDDQQQQGDDQPRSGIWKVEVNPTRSPRNLSTINEEGYNSAEPSPRNNSLSAESTPRGDMNDAAASPEVTPHVTDEPTSNVDAHQHTEVASDTQVKALGALAIVDDYIATPSAPILKVEDDTPKQLLKVKHEDLEDMEDLRQEEIDIVKSKLGALELKHITLGVLLIAHQGQWEVTNLNGILILAVDYVRKSYVLRLYKRDTIGAVWEHRFHKGFIYQQATPTFHTFETSEHNPLIYGLKLFNEQDAKDLHSKVLYFKNTLVKTKEELEAEKQQKSAAPLPSALAQPAQQAPNTNNESHSKSKSKGKKNKRGFFDKIFGKSDSSSKDFQISGPSNFKHASHIGVDEKGEFQITNIPGEWKEIFRQAGIRKQDIKDMETFNFVVNVINDAVETQQAVAIHEERQQLQESNEAIVNNTNTTTSPDVDHEPQAIVIEVKKAPPLPPRPAFMKDEHVEQKKTVETKLEVVVAEHQVTPATTEISTESQQSPRNMASAAPAPPPPPPPPVITAEAKSPTVNKKSILADLPPPPPARATLLTEIQQGTKLRKVETGDQALPDIKGLNQKQTKSLADTLAQAMATRRFEMQEAPSTTSTSNDDDWD